MEYASGEVVDLLQKVIAEIDQPILDPTKRKKVTLALSLIAVVFEVDKNLSVKIITMAGDDR